MKLAEALALRAEYKQQMGEIYRRVSANSSVVEGDEPNEYPEELLEEYVQLLNCWQDLVVSINETNNQTVLDNGVTLAQAIVQRDAAKMEHTTFQSAAELMRNARAHNAYRRLASELRYVPTMDAKDLQRHADQAAKWARELDSRIQEMNWLTELIEYEFRGPDYERVIKDEE